jgi:hypothetical protein
MSIVFLFISIFGYTQSNVTISSDKTYITESESLNVIATLDAVSASDVTVNFTFSGTADDVTDYTTMAGPFTVAGNSSGSGGSTSALLDYPYGLCVDALGNVYIADQHNNRIQKWAPGASVGTTVAGTGTAGNGPDELDGPSDVYVDGSGNIYIADTDNNRVQLWASGASTGVTVAGQADGTGGSAADQLSLPQSVYVDGSGNVYVSDRGNNRVQRWASSATTGVTVAGTGSSGSTADALNYPMGIFVDASGTLYIADAGNHRVQQWLSGASSGTTVAGTSGASGSDASHLNLPFDVFVDASGSIYVADALNHRVQEWLASATEGTTVAGGNGQGNSTNQFDVPSGVYVDAAAKIYVSDRNNNRVQQNQYSPSIIIEAGDLSGSLLVEGVVDSDNTEGDETIIVDVAGVTNATLVEPSQQTLYIVCTAAPDGEQTQTFCNSGTVADLSAIGTAIQWYAASSGGSPLATTVVLVDGNHYYATQTVDGCESLERFETLVQINTPAAPTGDASQTFIDHATVADLVATGSNIKWYAAASGGTALASSTALSDGTSYFASQTTSTGCESASRLEVAVTITPITSDSWVGGTDSDWNTAANWASGVVPSASVNVSIPSGSSINLSGSGSCHNLTVEAGGGLVLSATLTVGGTVRVQSDATESGSLIFRGTGAIETNSKSSLGTSATITYERYLTSGRWHLLSTPLSGQTLENLLSSSGNDIEVSGSDYSMKDYLENTDSWSADYTSSTSGAMTIGKGYAVTRATDGIVSLSGTKNGDLNFALEQSTNGWNLLGNPYTSALRASSGGVDDYLLNTTNVDELDPVYAGIYIWEENTSNPHSTNNYKIINNAKTGSLTQQTHIQTGQGFFVKAKSSPGNFAFTTAMQEDESGIPFYKNGNESDLWKSFKLQAETSEAQANTLIAYNQDMTRGLDVSYDAGLLNSNPNLALYTHLVEDNNYNFMVQALPPDYDNLVIPIGLDAKAGDEVSFKVIENNMPDDYALVLEDHLLNKKQNLSELGSSYSVQLDKESKGIGRFYIKTVAQSSLGLDKDITKNLISVAAMPLNSQIRIEGENLKNALLQIYSIRGRLLQTTFLDANQINRVNFNHKTGIYLIKISNQEGVFTYKTAWVK